MVTRKKKLLLIVAWILALSMCATAFATEGGTPAGDATPVNEPAPTAVVTITVVDQDGNEEPGKSVQASQVAGEDVPEPTKPIDATATPNDTEGENGYTEDASGIEVSQTKTSTDDDGNTVGDNTQLVVPLPQETSAPGTTVTVDPKGDFVPSDGETSDEAEKAANAAGVYTDEYTSDGQEIEYSEKTKTQIEKILKDQGITFDEDAEITSVTIGELDITADKSVTNAVVVKDAQGNLLTEGYQVALNVTASGSVEVDGEIGGGTEFTGTLKNFVLVLDASQSMEMSEYNLDDGNVTRWSVLQEAVKEFANIIFGDGTTDNPGIPDATISVVAYSDTAAAFGTYTRVGIAGENESTTFDLNALLELIKPTNEKAPIVDYNYDDGSILTMSDSRNNFLDQVGTGKTDRLYKDEDGNLLFYTEGKKRQQTTDEDVIESGKANAIKIGHGGTNNESGYVKALELVKQLKEDSSIPDGDFEVVYMTDGEANKSTSKLGRNETAKTVAADAAVELLKEASIHNIVIGKETHDIRDYMDPDYTYEKGKTKRPGYLNWKLQTVSENDIKFSMGYTPATTAEEIKKAYVDLATQFVNQAAADAIVAQSAKVIDVVPAGFDVYFVEGESRAEVIGYDAEGNTVIEWNIGALKDGDSKNFSYFVAPNSKLGDNYTYGTAFTNDSAVLFCEPIDQPEGKKIAIVMERPAVALQPDAKEDETTQDYEKFSKNLIDGFDVDGQDSGAQSQDRIEASMTEVGEIRVSDVLNVKINGTDISATIDDSDAKSISVDLGNYGKLTIDRKTGEMEYEPVGDWQESWGNRFTITFDYKIGAIGHDNEIAVFGMLEANNEDTFPFAASSTATITINGPEAVPTTRPDRRPRPTPTPSEEIPLGPVAEEIPLGVPQTGAIDASGWALLAIVSLLFAASLTAWVMLSRRRARR